MNQKSLDQNQVSNEDEEEHKSQGIETNEKKQVDKETQTDPESIIKDIIKMKKEEDSNSKVQPHDPKLRECCCSKCTIC